jgi:predicted CXXCH cytochrome family protein
MRDGDAAIIMAPIVARACWFAAASAAPLLILASSARTPAASTAPGATFVGAQACASCHREQYETWKGGRHSRMLQRATAASVKGDFAIGAATLHGRRYRLRAVNGEYFITESYLTGKEQEHRVAYTLGSRRIQHYLTTIDKGRIVILPPSWDVQRREWFDNMDIVRPDEDDRTPVQQWNKNCFGCHVSEQDNHYDPSTRTYATTWRDAGTSCERCHGPGSAHVRTYAQAPAPASVTERAIVRPTHLDAAAGSAVCAQCHSLRDVLAPGFVAGANYYDYFLPLLEYGTWRKEDPAYWADGRPRRFSNDAIGLWQSQCFLRGGLTCTACHRDPHEPDIEKNPRLASDNNAICTRCHRDVGAALSAHTRHREGSTGSSCVECHMPKTVVSIKSSMRDHTISVPAPENTVTFGIPNACTECHRDKSAAWAVGTLRQWWPSGRRAKLMARAQAFAAARAGRPGAVDGLIAIAADGTQGPLVQANAAGYLGNYSDPRAVAALVAAARSDHPAIRAAAVASLGRLPIARARDTLVAALDDPRRAVRIPAFMALFNGGGGPFSAAEDVTVRRVAVEFTARARLNEDDAKSQRDLGLAALLLGEFDRSADALGISLALDPDGPSSRFLLALARLGQRRLDEARTLLRQVPRSDPSYSAAQARLKQLELRQ